MGNNSIWILWRVKFITRLKHLGDLFKLKLLSLRSEKFLIALIFTTISHFHEPSKEFTLVIFLRHLEFSTTVLDLFLRLSETNIFNPFIVWGRSLTSFILGGQMFPRYFHLWLFLWRNIMSTNTQNLLIALATQISFYFWSVYCWLLDNLEFFCKGWA